MKKLKIGVLGASNHLMTRILLPVSKCDTLEIVAIGSRDLEKAKELANKWDIPKAYGSYDEVLEDKEIEAVYIPLPNHMHLEYIEKAAKAGKHILCEKPLALNAEETKDLIDIRNKYQVKIMEAFMYRFHPKWMMVKDLMKANGIGEVNAIHTVFTYGNNDLKNIRNIKEYGGGALMDIGCYAISSARYIMNKEPEKVIGLVEYSEKTQTDILSSAMLDFGKARAVFTVSTSTFPAQEVKIYGTGGTLEVKIPFNDYDDCKGQVVITTGLGERSVEFEPTNQYGEMFKAFALAIKEDKPVPLSLEDSYMNSRIIDQIVVSGQSGSWESIMTD